MCIIVYKYSGILPVNPIRAYGCPPSMFRGKSMKTSPHTQHFCLCCVEKTLKSLYQIRTVNVTMIYITTLCYISVTVPVVQSREVDCAITGNKQKGYTGVAVQVKSTGHHLQVKRKGDTFHTHLYRTFNRQD